MMAIPPSTHNTYPLAAIICEKKFGRIFATAKKSTSCLNSWNQNHYPHPFTSLYKGMPKP